MLEILSMFLTLGLLTLTVPRSKSVIEAPEMSSTMLQIMEIITWWREQKCQQATLRSKLSETSGFVPGIWNDWLDFERLFVIRVTLRSKKPEVRRQLLYKACNYWSSKGSFPSCCYSFRLFGSPLLPFCLSSQELHCLPRLFILSPSHYASYYPHEQVPPRSSGSYPPRTSGNDGCIPSQNLSPFTVDS